MMHTKREEMQARLIAILAELRGVDPDSIDIRERFSRYGLDSMGAARLVAELGATLARELPPTVVWEHPTIETLSRHLTEGAPEVVANTGVQRRTDGEPIAIIGMACRFPKAASLDAFWELLRGGANVVSEMPEGRWDVHGLYDPDVSSPGKMSTRWGGFLDQVDQFDPTFFGISPREAVQMDPQQRLMLELSWEALEDAGVPPKDLIDSRTGAFFGAMWSDYARVADGELDLITPHTATGQDLSIIPARVSYTLGLRGPSILVNTACSSSLVAVHLACQSLRGGESTLALAGGVNLILAPYSTIAMSKFGAMAPDGRSKAFDARANGYVRGEGGGVIVLKPLSRALADGDPVACVIRGSAVNNDGFSNGLTAPSPKAQEAVLREAYARASVVAHEVDYIETHGTGTMLGDPIEARAIGAVLGAGRAAERPLRLGSVKTNIGHLEAAAGIAGLIKVALAMKHRLLPPSIHFEQPNPHIDFAALNLDVQQALEPWPDRGAPPRAGVSSFGFGGTNCHVVLEGCHHRPAYLVPLSAGSPEQLSAIAHEVKSLSSKPLRELCAALVAQRRELDHRLALTVRSSDELAAQLDSFLAGRAAPGVARGTASGRRPTIVFVFGGQGSQWIGMGRDLIAEEPVFRAALERCDEAIQPYVSWSVIEELLAGRPEVLEDTELVQLTVFAVQVALAALLRSWGVQPDAVVGQSMGEVAAAHVAGALGIEDSARIMCRRSQIVKPASGRGGMAAVELSQEEARRLVAGYEGRVSIGIHVGPRSTALTGDLAALGEIQRQLQDQGVFYRPIKIAYASHSPQMDALSAELLESLRAIRPRRGDVPFYSTVTGALTDGSELDAAYWVRNLREPVLLFEALDRLRGDGHEVFVDLNPHPVVSRAVQQTLTQRGQRGLVLPSMRRDESGRAVLLDTLGTLYTKGCSIDWHALTPDDPASAPPELDPSREEASGASSTSAPARAEVLVWSAQGERAAGQLAGAMASWMAEHRGASIHDICYTASVRRSHHEHRVAAIGASRTELREALEASARGEAHPLVVQGQACLGRPPKVVFVFPGQGSQWIGMGRELLSQEPVFRTAMEACHEAILREAGFSLLDLLTSEDDPRVHNRIDVVQPALFAMEVALASLWRSWGVQPDAVVGHSMGEAAAAHVAGALSLGDAAKVICRRSRLLLRASGQGAMAVVELAMDEAERALSGYEDRLAVAVSNSPRSTVISGEPAALGDLLTKLSREQVFCRRVKVDVASHSPQMDPLLGELTDALSDLTPAELALPMLSTVTGESDPALVLDGEYWARNLRAPVRFSQAISRLSMDGFDLFVEMSPHPILVPAIQEGLAAAGRKGLSLGSLRREQPERRALLASLAALYTRGYPVAFRRLHPAGGRVVALPTYPFQRARHWIEAHSAGARAEGPMGRRDAASGAGGHPLLGAPFVVATQPNARFWERTLSVAAIPYLAEHRVQGEAVLPATAYLEMALSAAGAAYGPAARAAVQVAFEQMLGLPEGGSRTVQIVLTDDGAGRADFQISSREGDAWVQHAKGQLRTAPSDNDTASSLEDLDAIRARTRNVASSADHYAKMAERGLEYGPSFQGLTQLWRGDGEMLGRVRLPEQAASHAGEYTVHPALLDACFQLLVAQTCASTAWGTYVPVQIERLEVRQQPGREVWVHGTVDRRDDDGADTVRGDLRLMGDDGRVAVVVRGLVLRRLDGASAERDPAEQWLYALAWERRELKPKATRKSPGAWLLLLDRGGTGDALAARLEALGEPCVRVAAGERALRVAERRYEVNPSDPDGLGEILRTAFSKTLACRGVVHLFSLDTTPAEATTSDTLWDDQRLSTLSALGLAQAIAAQAFRDVPPLWLITRGAVAAGEADDVSLAQAPLWGFARSLSLEHPELQCRRVDLGDAPVVEQAEALAREIQSADGEDQIALRPEGRYVLRLVRGAFDEPANGAARALSPAGSRAFRLESRKPGVLSSLTLVEVERRAPGPGEVEVEVEVAGLNFIDVMKAMGIYPGLEEGAQSLGNECAGRVAAIGEGVKDLKVGDEVIAVAQGSIGSHVTTPALFVVPKPRGLSFQDAAVLPIVFMTAVYALRHLGRIEAGERVLIHSASGGTGLAAIQIARALGAEVFATAGSEQKRELLRSLGVKHVMDSRALSFAEETMALTDGQGVDLVLNSLTGDAISKSLEVLAPYGRFLEIGKRDIYGNSRLGLRPFGKSLSYFAIDLAALGVERPARFGALLREVMALFAAGTIEALPVQVFPAADAESAFRLMAQAKHIGKVAVALRDAEVRIAPATRARGARFRKDASYLITGGLGGLGLAAARWMVAEGARHIALLGRSGASTDAAREALRTLEHAGANVLVLRGDVSIRADVASALAQITERLPPLRGVVHAAGSLDDRMVMELDADRFRRVLAPKMLGAFHLHTLTRGEPLDFFVMYSSATAILGSPGQGNYCAANAFMDALAHERRAMGLSAMSVDWGTFSEVGLAAAQENRGARLSYRGIASMTPAEGARALGRLLDGQPTQIGVMRFDLRQWQEFYPRAAASPFWAELAKERSLKTESVHSEATRWREALIDEKPARRLALLEKHLCEQLGKVLRLEASRIDRSASFKALGMDSLMSLELRNRVEFSLGLKLSATLLFTYPNVSSLAEHLLGKLGLSPSDGADTTALAVDAGAARAADVQAAAQLSEAEAEAMLESKLAFFEEYLK